MFVVVNTKIVPYDMPLGGEVAGAPMLVFNVGLVAKRVVLLRVETGVGMALSAGPVTV